MLHSPVLSGWFCPENEYWLSKVKNISIWWVTGMLSFPYDIWMVVPRRILTELSQGNNIYIQQGCLVSPMITGWLYPEEYWLN